MITILHRDQAVNIRDLDGEIFILDERNNRIHHLNITASAIWRYLEIPASSKEVIAVFRSLYPDEDQHQLKKSIRTSLAWMLRKGILHRRKG